MDDAKKQIVDIIKNNTNILVAVSTNPSVDELSAALGLTILLNNLDKRATAVFSGAIPPAINFLEPDKTFENTADSLRDFIIALDKEKADHLRYKVDGDVVKIFITPYKTTLTQSDLDFSQGDYNVEVVLALGVKDQDHLDKALEAHGKILHDATVLTVTAGNDTSNLGTLDWHDGGSSSLSEMIVSLADGLKTDKTLLDEQIATAFLTGIVSATDRFSNDHTSSRAMTVAAQLMAAGANQQLIAAKLEEAHDIGPSAPSASSQSASSDEPAKTDGSELTISRAKRDIRPLSEIEKDLKSGEKPAAESDSSQQELEQQLAGITGQATGSMADIEKELHDADQEEPATTDSAQPSLDSAAPALPTPAPEPDQQTTPLDAPQLDFEPIPAPEPELPPLTPIVNEHSADFSDTPPEQSLPPLNSMQNGPNDGQATVDPFVSAPPIPPIDTSFVPPLEPIQEPAPIGGTDEGAAALASMPEPALDPLQESASTSSSSLPELPPLPPLPPDLSQTPLPPPPPLPPVFDASASSSPSGAVSGDIFGDGDISQAAPQPPVASEPGQFKIPGQN